MKVILLEDVAKLGKRDDVVDVNPGYARNFLFRRKLAVEATPAAMNDVAMRRRAEAAKAENAREVAQEMGEALKGRTFTIMMKSGEGGRLYGTLTAMDIAAALLEQGFDVDRRNIVIHTPLKQVGSTGVTLKLHSEVAVPITIEVLSKP